MNPRAVFLISRRELAGYLRTMSGYVIVAAILALEGLAFNAVSLGGVEKRSAEVLRQFFYWAGGFNVVAAALISMRLIAEERQSGTLSLLYSSPVKDAEIVLGKFLSAFAFLAILTALTIYMPLLILVNGKISFGHLLAGYVGVLLIGAASVAVGTFGSALAKNQLLAVIITAALLTVLFLCWTLAQVTERPFNDVLSAMAMWNQHQPAFNDGIIHLRDVVYYLAVIYVFLFGATRVLEARRWR